MAKFRLLDVLRPLAGITPEVSSPPRSVPFNMKIMFTSLALLIFLWMSQVQPFGILVTDAPDPLVSARPIIGATHGSLAELGLLPILTVAFGTQPLASARYLDVNFGLKEERALFGSAQKVLSVFVAAIQATFLVLSGIYGAPSALGPVIIVGLIVQLACATFVLALLDEVLQKGHGLGSGVMLFAGAHACTTAVWGATSLRTINTARGAQYEGALPALLHFVLGWHSISRGLVEAFWRSYLPNILGVAATLAVLAACAFLSRVRLEFPVKHVRMPSQRGSYPIKLLYTGAIPLLALGAFRANLLIASYAATYHLPNTLPIHLVFGFWSKKGVPVSGIASFLAPPTGFVNALVHPIRTIAYAALSVSICAFFSAAWISATGSEAHNVAKQLQEQQLTMIGFREGTMSKELKRAVPTAALLGGAITGVVAVLGDIAGAIGGGACAFIGLTIVQTYVSMAMMESGYGDIPGAQIMADAF